MVRRQHRFDPQIVRGGEIRGTYGGSLTLADAEVLGRAFGKIVRDREGRRIALAFDGRRSSPDLAAAAASGLMGAGLAVLRAGRGPTPMLCYAVRRLDADAGLMVTGSHLPADWNGFNLYAGSYPCKPEDLDEIARIAAVGDFVVGEGSQVDTPVFSDYVAYLLAQSGEAARWRTAWDCAHGATGEVVAALTRRLRGEHFLTNAVVDGSFPCHPPDPHDPEAVAHLSRIVTENGCDFGIALGGDGAALGVLDGAGAPLRADLVLSLLAHEALEAHPGARIVIDIRAGQSLFDQVVRSGGIPIVSGPTPDAVRRKMMETGAVLGGQMDGRIVISDGRGLYEDAIVAALRALDALANSDSDMDRFRESVPLAFYVREVDVPCPADRIGGLIDQIGWDMSERGLGVVAAGGIRVTTDDGWWALWPSHDASRMVATLEGRDEAGLRSVKMALSEALERSNLAAPDLLEAAA